MALSINGKLLQLTNEYYINHGSTEAIKIDASVERVKSKLRAHFGTRIKNVIEFGSYKRDTILPRKYDQYSDVDLMVIFNHESINVKPATYRSYLVDFAEKQYSRSEVYRSSPTVTLELDHIKYDLVPAYEQGSLFFSTQKTIYIPQSDSSWMITDPNGFNSELTRVNIASNSNIKKVIRLLKAWNAKARYPISSFQLEQEIVRRSYFFCISLEDYFFVAINGLSSFRYGNVGASQKINSLKENAARIKSNLQANNLLSATLWLGHILPL